MAEMRKWTVLSLWLAVALLFVFLVWIPVVAAYRSYCFNNYDLGIYAQAFALLSPSSPNPWLSVRELFLFNDHFDPILFLLLPLKGLAAPALLLIHIEMLFIFAAIIPFFLLSRSGELSHAEAVFASLFLLFNPATLNALYYPAHPGTWSLLPLSWTCYFLVRGSTRWAILTFFFALLCKEEFPVLGMAIAAGLWLLKRRQAALCFAAISISWGLITFGLRPLLIGSAKQYTDSILSARGLFSAGGEGDLWGLLTRLSLMVLPLVPFLVSWRQDRKGKVPLSLVFVSMLLALFSIRLIGGWWFNHRSAPLVVPLLFAALPFLHRTPSWPRRRWVLAWLLLLGVAAAPVQKALLSYADKPFKKHCPSASDRLASLDGATQMLLTLPPGRAIVQGHLVPAVAARELVSHLGANSLIEEEARYLLVEKPPFGDAWPLKTEDVAATLERWRTQTGVRVVKEDGHVALMERAL